MDSRISLALMAKAKLVFENDDTFLAFPLTPLGYDRNELDFMAVDTAQEVANLCEFSLIVDRIPEGAIWGNTGERRLSDVYTAVLREATLPETTRSADEEAAYQKAWRFLHEEGEDGIPRDTAAVITYQRLRDAFITAFEAHNNAKSSAEHLTDPGAIAQWKDVDEPRLRAAMSAAKQRWENEGRSGVVEEARRVESTLGAKSAHLTWSQWAARCNPDLDYETDPVTNQRFPPSAFSPSNALDTGSWQRFTLVGREVDVLAREAPAELRARLGASDADLDVESVSFEYSSAGIMRSWFVSDVFRSRFWKFGDPTRVVSDGAAPPRGLCPSYVAGVVFARNLEVKPRSGTPNAPPPRPIRSMEWGFFDAAKFLPPRPAVTPPAVVLTGRPTATGRPRPAPMSKFVPGAVFGTKEVKPMGGSGKQFQHLDLQVFKAGSATPLQQRSRSMVRLKGGFVRAPVLAVDTGSKVAAPAAGEGDEKIIILAFICKRVPLSPDPDPTLQW